MHLRDRGPVRTHPTPLVCRRHCPPSMWRHLANEFETNASKQLVDCMNMLVAPSVEYYC